MRHDGHGHGQYPGGRQQLYLSSKTFETSEKSLRLAGTSELEWVEARLRSLDVDQTR